MFPYGIAPEPLDATTPDTINRLILHGARYHDRESVFTRGAEQNPDWRIDRHSIRLALALESELAVEAGAVVGLCLPFTLEWVLVERALWGLGASSAAGGESPDTTSIVLTAERVVELLERGATLDTPERASRFRAKARDVSPSALASIEADGVERSQATWVRDVEALLRENPARRGARRVLSSRSPAVAARVTAFAGWIDGLTETVFALQ